MDGVGAWIDRLVLGSRGYVGRPTIHPVLSSGLDALRAAYDRDELLAFPGFLAPGEAITPLERRGSGWIDLRWDSPFVPWDVTIAETYLAEPANRVAHARLFGSGPGPTVVALHGWGAGHLPFEAAVWPVRSWLRRGLRVVLPILPFHGRRGGPSRWSPPFPTFDARLSHEGFRHAVQDLTALLGWLRARGYGPIGLVGMSLGGYVAALLATLLDELAFLGMVIPLASLPDFARAHGRLGEGEVAARLHAVLEAVYRPSSPLARPPRIGSDRVRIWTTRGDRITGPAHAARLGAHFGAEPILCPGGHMLQIGLPWQGLVDWAAEQAGVSSARRS